MEQHCSPFIVSLIIVLIIIHCSCSTTFAQTHAQPPAKPPSQPSAQSPSTQAAPSPLTSAQVSPVSGGRTNITAVLEKAGRCTMFIRLLKSTQVDDQINKQLNNSNDRLTMFVPTDDAFSSLETGALNQFSDQKKFQLVQFHILPFYLPVSQFQTASNPLRTQAGSGDRFQFNVTAAGNQANVSTGVVNASVSSTIYTDYQLAIYQVDKVLIPNDFSSPAAPQAPVPAPAPLPLTKNAPPPTKGSSDVVPVETPPPSGAISFMMNQAFPLIFAIISSFSALCFSLA